MSKSIEGKLRVLAVFVALVSSVAIIWWYGTGVPLQGGVPPTRPAQTPTAQGSALAVVNQAAEALGGIDRVRSIRNITLAGYGQYASVGENTTASRYSPEKYEAANDLRRVYDLEHDRFEERERRNMLYPFLAKWGFSWALTDGVLDGDIAYDVTTRFSPGNHPVRVSRWGGDGVHMRRMWMLNDPIALVRAAMDPGTKLSAPRREGADTVLDITLKQGDKLSAAFSTDHLPAWVRWSNPQTDLGEATYTTYLTGYASINGLLLPLGYDTQMDWRNLDYFKLYVDHYGIDEPIADLAAPPEVRNAPEPPSFPLRPITAERVADHLWRLSPNGTTVIEFKDHLTLFELDAEVHQAKEVIAFARTLAPGKPVTQLIASHYHFDHTSGLREAVAEGLTIIARRGNEGVFREMATHPDPDFPDDLAQSPKPLKFMPVDERLKLADDTMTLEVLWARNNIHMVDAVFAYAPAQKVIIEADIATAAYDYEFWPDNLHDLIDYYKLDVEKDSPVHAVVPNHPGGLTIAEVDELIKGGTQRARELCAAELAKGNYLPGCPVWSKRY